MNNYVLIGFMGCGKTTIGRELAGKTGMKQLDTDALIVQRAGMPVAEIFHKEGEQGFRRRETELLKELTSDGRENVIYSTGGGIVLQEENRELLRRLGTVILLEITPDEVIRRLGKDTTRPLLQGPDRMKKVRTLMARRRQAYEDCADICVVVSGKKPAEIAAEILCAVENKKTDREQK